MRLTVARIILAGLAAVSLYIGLWALFGPASFYAGFPAGRGWVEALPAYNEHLVRDLGGFNLVFAALWIWAAVTADRRLIIASSLTSLLFAVPHLIFHVGNLDGLAVGDQVAQVGSLSLAIVGPLAAAALVARPERGSAALT